MGDEHTRLYSGKVLQDLHPIQVSLYDRGNKTPVKPTYWRAGYRCFCKLVKGKLIRGIVQSALRERRGCSLTCRKMSSFRASLRQQLRPCST